MDTLRSFRDWVCERHAGKVATGRLREGRTSFSVRDDGGRFRPIPVAQDRPLSGESHLSLPAQRVSKATATLVEDKGVGFSQTSRRQLEATVEADLEQCNVRSSTRRPERLGRRLNVESTGRNPEQGHRARRAHAYRCTSVQLVRLISLILGRHPTFDRAHRSHEAGDLNRWLERNKHLAQDITRRQRSPNPHDSRRR